MLLCSELTVSPGPSVCQALSYPLPEPLAARAIKSVPDARLVAIVVAASVASPDALESPVVFCCSDRGGTPRSQTVEQLLLSIAICRTSMASSFGARATTGPSN